MILITCNYRADKTNVDRKHISSGVRLTTKEHKATFGGNWSGGNIAIKTHQNQTALKMGTLYMSYIKKCNVKGGREDRL